MNDLIKLEAVKKVYGSSLKTEVLKGIDLTVKEGELITIIGSSGSGKSTLVNIMSTIDQPTSGSVSLDGKLLTNKVDTAKLRNELIGFIFQDNYLIDSFNVLDNVLMPSFIKQNKYKRREKHEYALSLLDQVGLKGREKAKINELSGGQKQRVAIARALINEPKIIFADEPTGALDSENSENIINLLQKINETLQTTIIIITHDNEIANRGTRIIKVKDGQVISG